MRERIKSFDPAGEYFFPEGCHINELSNSADDDALSIARARLEPGKTTRWHRLAGIVERYVILEGNGRVEFGLEQKLTQAVGPGDVVIIPPLCPQRIANTGDGDLVFLAICSPRFRIDAYEDIEHVFSAQKPQE